jgi:hypothetical protein
MGGVHVSDIPYGNDYPEPDWFDQDGRRETSRRPRGDTDQTDEPTTWDAINLGPYLSGEVQQPQPSIGIVRDDGVRLLYPGREHAVLGETESGKSWLAIGCVAVELINDHRVVYVHYEEADPSSTIERLRLLGVPPDVITAGLRFVSPSRPVRVGWLEALLDPPPTLVVHDGVNEAMALHGADIMAADGASNFRRRLIAPCVRAGAATLACDHLPKNVDGRGRDAYGSVHKGNALDGARIVLENVKPFGRGLRGVSHVYVTKDRPGQLRVHGRPTKLPGKTYFGTLVVDDSPLSGPDFLTFIAPEDDEASAPKRDPAAELADIVHQVIGALPKSTVGSMRLLFAELRKDGHKFTDAAVRDAVADLMVSGLLAEVAGRRGARGYRTVLTAADAKGELSAAATASASASLIESDAPTQSHTAPRRDSATQSDALRRSPVESEDPEGI